MFLAAGAAIVTYVERDIHTNACDERRKTEGAQAPNREDIPALSTYVTGKVTPSAALLVRMRRAV